MRVMVVSFAEEGFSSLTVAEIVPPPTTVLRASVNEEIAGVAGPISRSADFVAVLYSAEIFTELELVTLVVMMLKTPEVLPCGIVRLAGTPATPESELDNATTTPPREQAPSVAVCL